MIRLLDLTQEVRELVRAGKLEMGHVKELQLNGVGNSEERFECSPNRGSDKKTKAKGGAQKKASATKRDPDVALLEVELSELFGSETVVTWNKRGKGSLVLDTQSR